MAAEPPWKCRPEPESRRPVFTVALVIVADGGGPEARADGHEDHYPDLIFPQQQADQQGLAPATWKPGFHNHVYVSLTSSVAFSLTDGPARLPWRPS